MIELEEWEAFINSNISEVMDGDVDSLTQLNMVWTLFSIKCSYRYARVTYSNLRVPLGSLVPYILLRRRQK